MPHNYSRKRLRDAALIARWDALDESVFTRIGLRREDVKAAQLGLQGWIVLPGDPDYDKDRMLFNPAFNPFPYAIVYCVVENDVALAVNVSQGSNLPFTVRSGGHCTAGFSAGPGMLIDVSNLNDVVIDPVGQTATVGCGTTFGKLDAALATYGLHVPGGECDDVCVGGYVQGGGYGFTSVTFGMNCDNVLALRVMLYNGGIVTATPTQNQDLWWAMRGGTGGSFGVLLHVVYQLRPLGDVFGWAIIWPLQTETDFDNATGALMALQTSYMRTAASPNLNIQVSLCQQPGTVAGLPPSPTYPYLMVRGMFVGNAVDGQAAIQALCNLPGAITQWTAVDSFVNLNQNLLNVPYGMPNFPQGSGAPNEAKASRYVAADWTPANWRSLLNLYVTSPNAWSYFYMEFYGGAINAYPLQNSAFIHRDVVFNAVMDVFWFTPEEQAPAQQFLADWLALMEPLYNGHVYQNYPRLADTHFASMYWGDNQAGLYAVKCKYDPFMLFTFAQVVGPLMPPGFGPGPVIVLPEWLQLALNQPIVYTSTIHLNDKKAQLT